ncbi:TPA: hypothetical protein PXN07_003944 [Yersinia enterocolitica]|nr:hypothetical protein [Yersinia enterocolitica]
MANIKLVYIGQSIADELYNGISNNIDRYTIDGPDFTDLISQGNWSIPLSIDYNPEPLQRLNHTASEIQNSVLVWESLKNLTPSLACENRIWTRLTHTECLDYSRKRWDVLKKNEESRESHIKKHFFATTMNHQRDDNAISRLWWNSWIASQYSKDDYKSALEVILRTADIRSGLVERPWMFRRREIASGIIRFLGEYFDDNMQNRENKFRTFTKILNREGSGIVFEGMPDSKVDNFIKECFELSAEEF